MFRSCNSKEGNFGFCFGVKLVPTIRMILFFDIPKLIVCVILNIYLHSFFIFLKHLIQYKLCLLPIHTVVSPVVSDKGPS